jgi:hypothetical protein
MPLAHVFADGNQKSACWPAASNWTGSDRRRIAALMGALLVCQVSNAQAVQSIELQGKDTSWRLVGSVEPNTGFQIGANGMVDFGNLFNDYGVTAGVTGNAFAAWCSRNWKSIAAAVDWLATVVADASKSDSSAQHWHWIDYINKNGGKVNYDEGGFFVVMTTNDRPPSKTDESNRVAAPALYYWYYKINQAGNNIAFDQKVWVWVKQHDGGHDAFSTSDFGDNSGSYTIWIDPDDKINDNETKSDSSAAHLELKRKQPNHHPK